MWQRWNQSTHIFENSSDEGANWTPTPLNASIINEGTINSARLPAMPAAAHHATHETGGTDAIVALSGSVITSGTVADARLSSNIPLKNASNVFTGQSQEITANSPAFLLRDSVQGTDLKVFRVVNAGQLLYLQTLNDGLANVSYMAMNRAGFVSAPYQPRTYVTANATVSLPNTAFTPIAFNTEQYDMGNCWTAGNPTAIFCPPAGDGFYFVIASVAFSTNSSGARFARISKNTNSQYQQYYPTTSGDQTLFQMVWAMPMVAGDYIQLILYHNSGATLDGIGSGLMMFKIW